MLETMEAEWRVPDVQAYERMQAHFANLQHREGQLRCLTGMFELEVPIAPGFTAAPVYA